MLTSDRGKRRHEFIGNGLMERWMGVMGSNAVDGHAGENGV